MSLEQIILMQWCIILVMAGEIFLLLVSRKHWVELADIYREHQYKLLVRAIIREECGEKDKKMEN